MENTRHGNRRSAAEILKQDSNRNTAANSAFVKEWLTRQIEQRINNRPHSKREADVFQIPLLHKRFDRSLQAIRPVNTIKTQRQLWIVK